MSYLIFIGVCYEVPTLEDAEKSRDLILKDDEETFIKIKGIK